MKQRLGYQRHLVIGTGVKDTWGIYTMKHIQQPAISRNEVMGCESIKTQEL